MIGCNKNYIDDEVYSKNLISVDDLKILFKLNNIQTEFSDDELENLITFEQNSMLAELGITLKPVQHVYTVYPNYSEPRKQTRVPITLPIVHVKHIDEIKINNKLLVEGVDFDFDELNSIIYLKPRHNHGLWFWFWYWYWDVALSVRVKYTTQFDDEIILDLLSSLLGDILVFGQTSMMQRNVKTITEGDVTVSWDNDSKYTRNLPKVIADKKDKILDLLNSTRVMMI